jgi:hypothetical protein
MKKLLFLLVLLPVISNSQTKLDSLIDVGNEYYNNGRKEKGLKIWKEIISKTTDSTKTFGTTMQNIQWYYIEKGDEKKLLENYHILMNSKVNDMELGNKIGEPFRNYRYHSTMNLAAFYAKRKKFKESLECVNVADYKLTYYTTSLTRYIFNKVDLAFWKYKLYNDLGDNENAKAALIHRALEYNYKGMYPNWATVQKSNDELELAETITKDQDIKKLKSQFDSSIESITFMSDKTTIITLNYNNKKYEINTYNMLTSKEDCIKYLKDSFFYNYLIEKIK